jgi:transposase
VAKFIAWAALPRVAAEMALHVLVYNLTRVMNIMGIQPLVAAMRA